MCVCVRGPPLVRLTRVGRRKMFSVGLTARGSPDIKDVGGFRQALLGQQVWGWGSPVAGPGNMGSSALQCALIARDDPALGFCASSVQGAPSEQTPETRPTKNREEG